MGIMLSFLTFCLELMGLITTEIVFIRLWYQSPEILKNLYRKINNIRKHDIDKIYVISKNASVIS